MEFFRCVTYVLGRKVTKKALKPFKSKKVPALEKPTVERLIAEVCKREGEPWPASGMAKIAEDVAAETGEDVKAFHAAMVRMLILRKIENTG